MDVVCLGELLIDLFPAEIGLRLAEVSAFHPKPGGAPANVAVALARLGCDSAFIGKLGDDAFGHHLAKTLAQSGVETRAIRFDEYARTTLAFIASPDPHTAEFLFYRNPGADTRLTPEDLDRELLAQTKLLHFGSLSLVEEPIRSAALAAVSLVRERGALVSLDVNYRPTLWPSAETAYQAVRAVLPQINLLKVNEVELELLTGLSDPEAGSAKLLAFGPQICVLTAGAGGSYFRVKDGFGFVPAFPVETVDATGCGDAFIAGLLSRLVNAGSSLENQTPADLRRHLLFANGVGALTAQKQGVIPALPTADAVLAFLNQQSVWRDEYA